MNRVPHEYEIWQREIAGHRPFWTEERKGWLLALVGLGLVLAAVGVGL